MTAAIPFAALDWVFLFWFLAVTTGVGLWYARRGGKSLGEYFLSGRNLPGWMLGTSMVATTFAADTPIVVTGFVLAQGISKNWLWWSFLFGGTLTVCLFSRWWRRAEIATEVELIRLRYEGPAANGLRGFKAVYLAIASAVVIGWVTDAMITVLGAVFDVNPIWPIAALLALTLVQSLASGLWGVVAADVLQFAMAMIGSLVLAILAVDQAGGLGAMVERVSALEVEHGRDILSIFPTGWDALTAAVTVLVLVNWWAVYYPGNEPGGGGYVAQRMFAAKDERHARSGALWYVLAHYVLRPWPWILVALCAVALEPRFLDPQTYGNAFQGEKAYPWMFHVLPTGLVGLVVASFVAAYISTITTQVNLAASFLVNDLWLPFIARGSFTDRQRMRVARGAVLLVTTLGCIITALLQSAGSGWELLMEATAGTGLVLILRWLWWRINAWSEIAAMTASALTCILARTLLAQPLARLAQDQDILLGPLRLLLAVGVSTLTWIAVTFLTRPVSTHHLVAFYRKIRPWGAWGRIAQEAQIPPTRIGNDLLLWLTSSAMVFGGLFGVGSLLLQQTGTGITFLTIGVISAAIFFNRLRAD